MSRPPNKKLKLITELKIGESLTISELAALADCSYVYAELVLKQLGDAVERDGKSATGANRYRWVSEVERTSSSAPASTPAPSALPRIDDTLHVVGVRRRSSSEVELDLRRPADGGLFHVVLPA